MSNSIKSELSDNSEIGKCAATLTNACDEEIQPRRFNVDTKPPSSQCSRRWAVRVTCVGSSIVFPAIGNLLVGFDYREPR